MTETQLKTRVGLFVVIAHFSILILVLVLYVLGGFLFNEMTTTSALIVPMFSVYTTAIIKYIIAGKNRMPCKGDPVTGEYAFIAWFVPGLFVGVLIAAILLKAFNVGFSSFEEFKIMMGVLETVFGAYVGLVLASMYQIPPGKRRR